MDYNILIQIVLELFSLVVIGNNAGSLYNCFNLHEKCNAGNSNDYNCQLDLIIMSKVCGEYFSDDSLSGCIRANEQSCRGAIKTMNQKHKFANCNCQVDAAQLSPPEMIRCNNLHKTLVQHPCLAPQPRYKPIPSTIQTTSPSDNPRQFMIKNYEVLLSSGLRVLLGSLGLFAESQIGSKSCIVKQQECQQNPNCYLAWNKFEENCKFKNCDKNGESCVTAYQILRQFGMFDCSCVSFHLHQPSNMKICLTIQTNLRDNRCLAFLNNRVMYQTLLFSNSDNSINLAETIPKNLENLQLKTANCLDTYQECIQTSQCLQRYIEIERQCIPTTDQTNYEPSYCKDYSKCQRAVRSFYSRPDAITLNAVRCICPKSLPTIINDTPQRDTTSIVACTNQKAVFQPMCMQKGSTQINCLQLMTQCLNDTACLDSFTVFNELCAPVYLNQDNSKICQQNYLKCLDAYRTIWGTLLTSKCSCHSSQIERFVSNKYPWSSDPMKICQFFQNMIVEPKCPSELARREIVIENTEKIRAEDDPCSLIKRHYLPRDEYIRMNSQNDCPLVCKCNEKCFYLPCENYLNRYFKHVNTMAYSNKCRIFNVGSSNCLCSYNSLVCGTNSDNSYRNTHYKLSVSFNMSEFLLIQQNNLIGGIQTIAERLNQLLIVTTGFTNCRLSFQQAHYHKLIFSLQINMNVESSNVQQYNNQLFSSKHQINYFTTECVLSIKLLQIMINRHYSEITYSLPLSILSSADVIIPSTTKLQQQQQQQQPAQSPNSQHSSSILANRMKDLGENSSNQNQVLMWLFILCAIFQYFCNNYCM